MSYPSNLTAEEKEFWDLRMKMPVKKGTIVCVGTDAYKILEDTTAHGCPFVILVDSEGNEIGSKMAMTLNLHSRENAKEWAQKQKNGGAAVDRVRTRFTPYDRFDILDFEE